MSRQPEDLRGSAQITPRRNGVAAAAFTAGLIACVPADPYPADTMTGRIPALMRATQHELRTHLNQTAAEITR